MKKRFLVFVLFMMATQFFSEENYLNKLFSHTDEFGELTIKEDKLIFDSGTENGSIQKFVGFDMFVSEAHKYIILNYNDKNTEFLTLLKEMSGKDKYAAWEMTYFGWASKKYLSAKLIGFNVIRADSYIEETDKSGNKVKFLPVSYFNRLTNPWAIKKDSKEPVIYLNTERYRVKGFNYAPIERL